MDRLGAVGRGAAQSATGGFVDEIYPKILNALPFDDKTGIPREYAGGSAENQYKSEYRQDDADAQAKYPLNFGAGQVLGAAPAALATGGLGAGGQVAAGVGMGALQGAGASENSGSELAKDAVRGGALGGAFGAAGNAVSAAAPGLKAAWSKLRQGPPQMQPAMAGAAAPRPMPQAVSAPILNKSEGMLPPKGLSPGRYAEIKDIPMPRSPGAQADAALGSAPTEMAPRPQGNLPPRPTTADLSDVMAPTTGQSLAKEEANAQNVMAGNGRTSYAPELFDPAKPLPKNPAWKHFNGVPDDQVDALEARLRQTEASGQKRIDARIADRNDPKPKTVRPGKGRAR